MSNSPITASGYGLPSSYFTSSVSSSSSASSASASSASSKSQATISKEESVRRAEASALEYREIFAYFAGDRRADGSIMNSAEFSQAIRALGHAPTGFELKMLCKVIDNVFGGALTYSSFV